jgi:endonuclease/exonuclease/phosphatase family metal-dependent hydrolase
VDVLNHIYLKVAELGYQPDLLVLGFQETRYGFEYYLPDSKLSGDYTLIRKLRMNGIGNVGIRGLGLYILRYNNSDIPIEYIEENWVRFNYQYFGKGAIAITLKIKEINFLFINTHLPYDCGWEGGGIKERVDSLNVIFDYIITKNTHTYLFLMGDFNFRIHLKTKNPLANLITEDDPKLFEMYIRNKGWNLILYNDELYLLSYFYNNSLADLMYNKYGEEFGYQLDIPLLPYYKDLIDKPNFPPTYKVYNNRSEVLDMDNKVLELERFYCRWDTDRIPSWCDRILTAQYPGIKRLVYTCDDHLYVNQSDHLPVYSLFEIDNNLLELY